MLATISVACRYFFSAEEIPVLQQPLQHGIHFSVEKSEGLVKFLTLTEAPLSTLPVHRYFKFD